jgi:AmmeMemoRadiSam system protein B/AmmeMemoRadiSam system protein A
MRAWFLVLSLLIGVTAAAADTRQPLVAGSFYPADRAELSFQISKFLAKAPDRQEAGDPIALIVPHAGYQYSGQIAACAYKLAAGGSYDRVILIGQSHKLTYDEIAVPDYQFFATPLGEIPVDQAFAAQLVKLSDRIRVNNAPFAEADNALETQFPFIQTVLPSAEIVPLYFGSLSLANCQSLAYALTYLVDDRTLIVVSTDWSHNYPDYLGRKMDRQGLKTVVAGSLEAFIGALVRGETEACGAPGVITALLLAPALGVNRIELLKYGNSGVGYAAVAFSREETKLSAGDRQKLIKIARRSIAAKVTGKKVPLFTPPEASLTEKRGAFVTLQDEGKPRGCIGYVQPVAPLYLTVQDAALAAATADDRFVPVREEELKELTIELSVLSRLRRIKAATEVQPGRDGLYIIKGENSGVLLPQVAVEQGWDTEEFLKQVCLKAGLPEDAWQDQEAQLYRFSAEVFTE